MNKITAAAAAAFSFGVLWVGPAPADPAYDHCIDSTKTNTEWGDCGAAYVERMENVLNIAWKKAISTLEGEGRAQLLREQRAWIKFKESSCLFYKNWYDFGREGQVLHYYGCRAAIIQARISDLEVVDALTHQ